MNLLTACPNIGNVRQLALTGAPVVGKPDSGYTGSLDIAQRTNHRKIATRGAKYWRGVSRIACRAASSATLTYLFINPPPRGNQSSSTTGEVYRERKLKVSKSHPVALEGFFASHLRRVSV